MAVRSRMRTWAEKVATPRGCHERSCGGFFILEMFPASRSRSLDAREPRTGGRGLEVSLPGRVDVEEASNNHSAVSSASVELGSPWQTLPPMEWPITVFASEKGRDSAVMRVVRMSVHSGSGELPETPRQRRVGALSRIIRSATLLFPSLIVATREHACFGVALSRLARW